ncbi:hypothetical protein [Paraburkholderia tropica]|uniref:hypothetical protein n=1 Tax=Paraburkholderia tropica TaxID=92647 RepID=UPI002AB0673B|nr:hypothetical protein [Paraburkholderia tropica]
MTETSIAVNQAPESPNDSGNESIEGIRLREHLREAYGVESMFVRVSTLSRILGIAPATVRASMRSGRFALPHVVVCSAPLVRTDQLIDWILALSARPRAAAPSPAEGSGQRNERHFDSSDTGISDRRTMRQLRKRMVHETLAKMRQASGQTQE